MARRIYSDEMVAASHAMACAEVGWLTGEADRLSALLREALSKNGPRAHADFCDGTKGCWMCRSRALLGIEEGR